MILKYSKDFEKDLAKLSEKQFERVRKTIVLFQEIPFHPTLRNHVLKGKQKGLRSISAGGDLRIIFRETGGYVEILFLRVGTHNQVYE